MYVSRLLLEKRAGLNCLRVAARMPSSEFVTPRPDRFRRPAQPVQDRLPAFLLQGVVDRPRREPSEIAHDRVQLLSGRNDQV